jgi:hypothetical protein
MTSRLILLATQCDHSEYYELINDISFIRMNHILKFLHQIKKFDVRTPKYKENLQCHLNIVFLRTFN